MAASKTITFSVKSFKSHIFPIFFLYALSQNPSSKTNEVKAQADFILNETLQGTWYTTRDAKAYNIKKAFLSEGYLTEEGAQAIKITKKGVLQLRKWLKELHGFCELTNKVINVLGDA